MRRFFQSLRTRRGGTFDYSEPEQQKAIVHADL